MSIADSIIIDPEFESFNDPLETEEFEQLLSNVRADGKFTDPLICWDRDGDWVLIDGHNRWRIWKDFYDYDLKIEPHVVSLKFDDRDDVLLWIANHQRGRRNETPAARALKVLKLKPILERKAKARQAGGQGGVLLSQNSDEANEPLRVDEEMAKRAEVSRDTIRKVETVATKGSADLQTAMKKGKVSVDVAAKAAELPAAKQAEVVKAINESPKPKKAAADAVKSIREAVSELGCGQVIREKKPASEELSPTQVGLQRLWRKSTKAERKWFLKWVEASE